MYTVYVYKRNTCISNQKTNKQTNNVCTREETHGWVGGVMNVIFLPTIFVRLLRFHSSTPHPSHFFFSCLHLCRRKPKLCYAIKKKLQECVSRMSWLCARLTWAGGREPACHSTPTATNPSARLRNSTTYFQTEKKKSRHSIWGGRREEERGQCGLCLDLMFSGERSNQ